MSGEAGSLEEDLGSLRRVRLNSIGEANCFVLHSEGTLLVAPFRTLSLCPFHVACVREPRKHVIIILIMPIIISIVIIIARLVATIINAVIFSRVLILSSLLLTLF